MINVNGSNGTSIVFSCTWNENKKNEKDDVSNAKFNNGNKGPGLECLSWSLDSVSMTRKQAPFFNSPMTLGKNPNAVRPAETLTRVSEERKFLHLTRTLEKHQKFATLSSKSPRPKGNIRVIGSRIVRGDENGGRNGRNRTTNAPLVAIASRKNRFRL